MCGSLLTHGLFCLLLPCAPYASGRAGVGLHSLLHPLVGHTPLLTRLLLRSSLRGVVRHVTYLRLCSCVCARPSPFLSLPTMLRVRGGGGRFVLAAACWYGHTLRSLFVRRAGVGMGHPCVCGHTFFLILPACGAGMALGCTPSVTFVRCM